MFASIRKTTVVGQRVCKGEDKMGRCRGTVRGVGVQGRGLQGVQEDCSVRGSSEAQGDSKG